MTGEAGKYSYGSPPVTTVAAADPPGAPVSSASLKMRQIQKVSAD